MNATGVSKAAEDHRGWRLLTKRAWALATEKIHLVRIEDQMLLSLIFSMWVQDVDLKEEELKYRSVFFCHSEQTSGVQTNGKPQWLGPFSWMFMTEGEFWLFCKMYNLMRFVLLLVKPFAFLFGRSK